MFTTKEFTFTWKIENYSKFIPKNNDYFESDTFVTDYSGRHEWSLKLHNNGWSKKPGDVWCSLFRKAGHGSISVDCIFQLIDPFEKVFISSKMISKEYHKTESWGIPVITIDCLNETRTWKEDILTIRCILYFPEPTEQSPSDCKSQMKIGVNHNTYAWCIKEPESSEWCFSKVFTFTEMICLEVILTVSTEDIIIKVKNKSTVVHGSLYVTCKMTLLDARDVGQCSVTDKYRFDTDSSSLWYFPTFFTTNTLQEKNCISNGFFTLILEFFVPNGIISKEDKGLVKYEIISGVRSFEDGDVTSALQYDLKSMYFDKKHSDVSLKADEELFCAHKNILSSRSPIFRAMFDCEMLENKTNVVNITDVDSTTLRDFLQFLYTGTIEDGDCKSILQLLLAADKYQVKSLIEKCAQILMSLLTLENACDIIVIADMVKHVTLKASVMKFIEEEAAIILTSEEWSEWAKENKDLALEITTGLALQFANNSKSRRYHTDRYGNRISSVCHGNCKR